MGFESLCGSQEPSSAPAAPPVGELLPYHRLVSGLDPMEAPVAEAACGVSTAGIRRLVALPGSFNPVHRAHLALLDAAVVAWRADAGSYVLSALTVDKERVSGMLLEDRLWLLCRQIEADPARDARAVVVTNRGLYVDQAAALFGLFPTLGALAFVTGYDKIVQIFDPRYYTDRDAALDLLFSRASFLVAPRAGATRDDLHTLLARPENARYAARVTVLPLPLELAGVSSSRVRTGVDGRYANVPKRVVRFIRETGCYEDPVPAAYAARAQALLEAAQAQP